MINIISSFFLKKINKLLDTFKSTFFLINTRICTYGSIFLQSNQYLTMYLQDIFKQNPLEASITITAWPQLGNVFFNSTILFFLHVKRNPINNIQSLLQTKEATMVSSALSRWRNCLASREKFVELTHASNTMM